MARISQVGYADATPEQQAAHDAEILARGRMTNMKSTLLHSVPALRIYGEWFALRAELLPVIGDRAIFIFAQAISQATDSVIGTTFMRRALAQQGFNPDNLEPSDAEMDLVRFGAAIARDPKRINEAFWAPLSVRYSEKTLVDLVAFAGIMIATNVFCDAVGVSLDDELLPFLAP